MKKLNILSITISESIGAQAYYRFIQANKELVNKNLIEFRYTPEYRNDFIDWADIVLMQRIPFYTNISVEREDGEITTETENYALSAVDYIKKTGKILIMDFDDNIFEITKDNPCIESIENLSTLDITNKILPYLDGITVTSKFLKDKLKDKVSCPIKILPNSIKVENWNFLKKSNDRITIGWEGGQSHEKNLDILYNVIPAIRDKYDNVDFVFFGYVPNFDYFDRNFELIPNDNGFVAFKVELTEEEEKSFNIDTDLLEYDKSVYARKHTSFADYRKTINDLNFDIGIYPLQDNNFSKGKSDLKYLQYSMLNIPTISSDIGVVEEDYTLVVKNNSEEWINALSTLIDDNYYREELGRKSREHVINTRSIEKTCMDWYNFYCDTYTNSIKNRKKLGKNKVSVILPVYNWEDAITLTLRSVMNQDYDNFELIVVDDGSVDNTFDVCSNFLSSYDNVKIIRVDENSGVSNARNVGINNSDGDYITFIDQDELYHQGRIARLARYLDDNKDKDMVFCHSIAELLRWKNNKKEYDIVSAKPFNTMMNGEIFIDDKNFVSPTEVMIRKNEDCIFNTDLGFGKEDQDLWIRIMKSRDNNIGTVPRILCTRRIHSENALQVMDSVQSQSWKDLDKNYRIKEFTNVPYFLKGTEEGEDYGYKYNVSLIILNKDDTDGVFDLLKSIEEDISFEVIVVDHYSKDTSINEVIDNNKYDINVLTMRSGENVALARNIGLNISRGKYVYFFESTYRLTKNLLTNLFNIAEKDYSVGIIAPTMINGNDVPQDVSLVKNKDNKIESVAYNYTEGEDNLYQVFKASGLIRSRVFEVTGFYDNKYRYKSEDIDFCDRLSENGYRVIMNTGVKIIRLDKSKNVMASNFSDIKIKKKKKSDNKKVSSLIGY